jgi:hypothetical protein
VVLTEEFKKVTEELDKIPDQEKIKKSYERYVSFGSFHIKLIDQNFF